MSTTDLELAPENGLTRPKSANLTVALIVIAMAQLMIVLDATIVNIALPHIKTTSPSAVPGCSGSSRRTRCPSGLCYCSAAAWVT